MTTAKFTSTKQTNFRNQKGVDINVENEGVSTVFNVWCDTIDIDNPSIRVAINNDRETPIFVSVEDSDFKEPEVSYSDDKSHCYVTFDNYSLHIKLAHEGIVFDVWDKTDNENGSIDSTFVYYNELEEAV